MPLAREVRARFVAEIDGLRRGFQSVRREAENLGPSVRRSTDAANRNYDKLGRKVDELNKTLAATGKIDQFEELNQAAERARREFEAVGKVSEETMERLNSSIEQASDTLGNMEPDVRSSFGRIESVLAETREELDTLTTSSERATDALSDLGSDTNLDAFNREIGTAEEELDNLQQTAESAGDQFREMARDAQRESDNMSESFGGIGESAGRMGRSVVDSTERSFEAAGRAGENFRRRMDNLDPFAQIERESRQLARTIGQPLENLPDHLRPFRDQITETRTELNQLGRQGGQSIDQLSAAAVRSRIAASGLTSMTSSGKEAAKIVQQLTERTREAQLAVMGLNEDGTVQISTEESERRLEQFQREIDETRARLETLRDAGDQGSYDAGMRALERSLMDVDRSFRATNDGGRMYTTMLREMGIYTSDTANQMGIDMERMRGRFMYNLDMMNNRSTLAKKMMDFLPESSHIQRIDRFFLGIGDHLSRTATRGSAANQAIELLGRNAPMKKINDMVRMINQGVMGVQQVAMIGSVVFAAFTAAMVMGAKGPSPMETAQAAAEAMAAYQEEVEKRYVEIRDTWNAFEDIQLNPLPSADALIANIEEQKAAMEGWYSDIQSLESRVNNVDLMAYLRDLGPEAASEISALNSMTAAELDVWVRTWEEKSEIAMRAAVSELEWMRIQTEKEIQRMQESLKPLGIAWQEFLQAWTLAVGPFVNTWGVIAAKVVDGATAIGNFINRLNDLSPQISAAAGMFTYLFTALVLLLSPLGVGIGLVRGMKANFSALYRMIQAGVTAFLRIAGAAMVVAGVLVALGVAFYNLWTKSENLRTSVASAWEQISGAIQTAFAVIQPSIDRLKEAFSNIFETEGGEKFNLTWEAAGDAIARFIDAIMKYMPVFNQVLTKAVSGAVIAIEWLIDAFGQIDRWWSANGPKIVAVVGSALGAVTDFIRATVQRWIDFFRSDGGQFLSAIGNIFQGIFTVVSTVFNAVWEVIKFIMPGILLLIKMIWSNIQGVINGALDVIMGAVKVFSGLFTGDFSKMWEGIKQIFSGAMEFLFNFIQLTFYGRILGGVKYFIVAFRSSFTSLWNGIKSIFQGNGQAVLAYLTRAWDEMARATSTIWGNIVGFFKSVWSGITAVFNGAVSGVAGILTNTWAGIIGGIKTLWSGIQTFMSSAAGLVARGVMTALASLGIDLGAEFNKIKGIVETVWNAIKDATTVAWALIVTAVKTAGSGISAAWVTISGAVVKVVTDLVSAVVAKWSDITTGTSNAFKSVQATLSNIWQGISNAVSGYVAGVVKRVTDDWNAIKNVTSTIFGAVRDVITGYWTGIANFFGPILNGIKNAVSTVWGGISALTSSIFGGIRDFFSMIWSVISQIFTNVGAALLEIIRNAWTVLRTFTEMTFNNIATFFRTVWNTISGVFTAVLNTIVQFVQNRWNTLRTNTETIFNAVRSFLKTLWDGISTATRAIVDALVQFFQQRWTNLRTNTETVFNAIRNFLKTTWDTISSVLNGIISALVTFFQQRWSNLRTNTETVFNAVKTFLTNTWNGIRTFLSGVLDSILSIFRGKNSETKSNTETSHAGIRDYIRLMWNTIKDFLSGVLSNILTNVRNSWSTALTNTRNAFTDIYNAVRDRFNNIVDAARALPQRISDGLRAMASNVKSGINSVVNTMGRTLETGVNGVISGLNTILGNLGVSTRISPINVPEYAYGTDPKGRHPGGPMIVGDGVNKNAGPELIETPDGKSFLSPDEPTLMVAPRGTKVWSATETRELFDIGHGSNDHIPHYAFGDALRSVGSWVKSKVASAGSALLSMTGNPLKMLESAMTVTAPSASGFIGGMARGAFNKTKEAALSFVKGKIKDYLAMLAAAAAGGGTNVTSGGGGVFPAPFRLTSPPGMRLNPVTKKMAMHNGWDYGAPAGTPIPAQAAGVVTQSGFHSIRGNYVRIRSQDGYDRIYQHNTRNAVGVGANVTRGQTIGYVGATGRSKGAHLHYEILKYEDGGIARNKQLAWLADGGWAESIISHDPAKRSTQAAIWNQTGEALGFKDGALNSEILAVLERIANGVETQRDIAIVMDERKVGQAVEKPVSEQQNLEAMRRNIFKPKGV